MSKKLISFIIKSEKGFFKKPDINEGIYLTYNIIHKPALLGILGAIIGLSGFKKNEELPEYYKKLNNIPIGIKPIGDDKGIFPKTVINYTNTTGLATYEKSGTLLISEQTLINPCYKIYLLLNLKDEIQKKLYEYILNQKAEFLPYMGKNDYSLWWNKDEVFEYEIEEFERNEEFTIDTIFKKEEPVIEMVVKAIGRKALYEQKNFFCYFERLPVGFDEKLFQYKIENFAYTNALLKKESKIESSNLYKIKGKEKVVFLY